LPLKSEKLTFEIAPRLILGGNGRQVALLQALTQSDPSRAIKRVEEMQVRSFNRLLSVF
jgi:hypothetical protein